MIRRIRATQPASKRSKSDEVLNGFSGNVQKWQSIPGMIQRVLLKNFMCHGELDYRPIDRLNFLNGANGSGKSAILTAIVFVLGGSARVSNRGTSNTGFIRNGQNSASVEITLYNEGDDAYQPDVYGNSITVIRTVTQSGASTYKIKDSRGKIVRDKRVREELDRIADNLGIQVDNPIAILNQDAAKTFLFKCDPPKLYEFFMRATQLEECKKDYNTAAEEKNASEALIREKQRSMADIKKDVDKWEKKYQFHQTLENKKDVLVKLKAELAWSMFKQAELEYSKTCKEMSTQNQKIEKANEQIENDATVQQNLKKEKVGVEKDIHSLANDSNTLDNVINGYKENVQAAKLNEKQIATQIVKNKNNITSKEQDLKVLVDAIRKVQDTDADEVRMEAENKNTRIRELTAQRDELEAQMQSTQTHLNNLTYNISSAASKEKELNASIIKISNEERYKERELISIQKQRDNKLVIFGDKFPELVDEIKKNKAFKVRPIGPLGAHIKLSAKTTPTEAKLIEWVLRNNLRTFIVDNFDDKRILDRLAGKCGIRITIITTTFRDNVYDVSNGKCHSEKYDTIYDRLEFDNPNVANCVIDQAKIEQILLINKESEAQQILKSTSTAPRNCLYALTDGLNQYFPVPSYRSYALDVNIGKRPLLQTSVDEMEEALHLEINAIQNRKAGVKKDLETVRNDIKEHQIQRSSSEQICKSLRPKIFKIGGEIQELKNEVENEKSPDIAALEEDKEKLEEDISTLNRLLEKLQTDIDDAKSETKRFSDLLKEKTDQFNEITSQSEPLREKLEKIEKECSSAARNQAHCRDKIKEYTTILEAKRTSMEEKKDKLDKAKEKAHCFSKDPIDTNRKADVIFRELQIAAESIKRAEKSTEPKEVVEQKYREISMFYNNLTEQIESLRTTIKYLDTMLRHRKKGFQNLRGSICRLISIDFMERLKARNYRGELSFDHLHNELEIFVDPNPEAGEEFSKRALKSLSGGEKSYSTISLILSLWTSIHSPFRILDEFDVFMDSLNRKIALDQIIDYAKEARKYQYVFLTPLSLDSLEEEKEDVSVVYFKKNEG